MKENEEQTNRIWSIPSQYDHIEKDDKKGKSKTTIVVCSIILLGVTAALTTWIFVVRPNFYPQLKIMSRDENKMADSFHHVQRRSGLLEGGDEFIEREAEVRSSIKKKESGRKNEVQKAKRKSNVKDIFTKVNEKETPYYSSRLPRDILPTDYYINLDVDLGKDSYTGVVAIDLKCTKETQYFIFHSRKLNIKDVVFASAMNTDHMKIKKILWFAKNEMYIVEMKEKFQMGKEYAVKIEFEAEFNQHLAGLYKSQYRGTDGKFRTVATSHFEPTDARTAFPCLDEPNFKAKFHIKIIHSAEYIALSNMPVEDTTDVGDGRVEDSFQVSVSMSTYLVAFAVVDFKFKEAKTDSGIKVRVYAPEGDYERIDHALEAGTIVLSFYEKFFGAPYPLPKLDLLAVPDFLAGAMEDWGLVSFRSSYLIYDKDFVTLDQKKMVTLVIAHELAHQWFGNLVTMKWWNDIWLNEGFANYVEMLGTNEVDDQFHSLDLQVPTGWQAALSLDSLKNSHPIDQEVDTPSEIDELFDAISYNKGAALLRMLKSFLGNDFIKGVKDYIQTHKFTNAETDDLWGHLKRADHTHQLEIKSIMDTWSRQSGYPVLTVTKDGEDLVISQKSFLLAKAESAKKSKKNKATKKEEDGDDKLPEDLHWHVPFTFFFDNDPETIKSVWLNNETRVRVKAPTDFKWVKGNADNQGYYIVNYDEATWKNIIKQLQKDHEVFSPVDRAGLIHDAFKLGCDGIIDPLIPLNLAKYLKKEKEYIPWAMARSKLDCITILISDKKLKRLYKKYFWYLMSHLVDASMLNVGKFNVKQPLDVFQRFDTFSFVMKYGFRKDFKKKLEDLFQDLKDGKKIPGLSAELRALAIIFGFDPKDDDDFKYLWKTYVETEFDSDRRFIMKAFSRVKDKKKLQVILDSSLDLKKVRAQDTIPLMMTLVRIGGRNQVWNFIEENFDKLTKRYGGQYQLGSLVTEVAGGFYKKKDYEQIKKFLTKHSLGKKGSRTERQVLEKMKNNMDKHISSVSDKKSDKIESWVKKEIKKIESKIRMNW